MPGAHTFAAFFGRLSCPFRRFPRALDHQERSCLPLFRTGAGLPVPACASKRVNGQGRGMLIGKGRDWGGAARDMAAPSGGIIGEVSGLSSEVLQRFHPLFYPRSVAVV